MHTSNMHVSMCVYVYSAAKMSSQAIATLSFSSLLISFIFSLHQKDTFSFYFALAVSCRLITALFFAFSFMAFFPSLSLSCLSAFVELLLSLCCCRGQNPSNGFCDRFRTVAAGALYSVRCSAAPCCCQRTSSTSLLLLLLSVLLDGWMDAHICI